jgi:protein NRD1
MPNIMEALANIARQNATAAQSNPSVAAPAPVSAPPPAPPYSAAVASHSHSNMPYFPPTSQPGVPPVNYQAPPPLAFPPPAQAAPAPAPALPVQPPAPGGVGNQPNAFAANNPTVQLVAALAAQGIPIDKIASVIQLMGQGGAAPAAAPPAPQVPPVPQMPQPAQTGYAAPPPAGAHGSGPAPWEVSRPDESRDRNGYHDSMRSPGRPRGRSRSRSPRGWDARGSPRTRNDRGFEYGRDDRDHGRGGRMPDYRQRSPPRRGPPSPEPEPTQKEKWVEYDNTLPPGTIKVYSRTLFVGGVTCSEFELRQTFSRFGQVQTCIVNKDKRHAFVKMYFRKDAEAAKAAMEENRGQELRTRWGVGFGPRDCSDYQSGISIIPIHKLTEADRKWMLTAPFGGSGGRPIVEGLSVEEPDIEIGAGVSSKAISRRMQTDKGGNHGPKSSRENNDPVNGIPVAERGGSGRWRHGREKRNSGASDHRRDDRNGKGGPSDEPVVLGLPAGITLGPNGINYPPNFAFQS